MQSGCLLDYQHQRRRALSHSTTKRQQKDLGKVWQRISGNSPGRSRNPVRAALCGAVLVPDRGLDLRPRDIGPRRSLQAAPE